MAPSRTCHISQPAQTSSMCMYTSQCHLTVSLLQCSMMSIKRQILSSRDDTQPALSPLWGWQTTQLPFFLLNIWHLTSDRSFLYSPSTNSSQLAKLQRRSVVRCLKDEVILSKPHAHYSAEGPCFSSVSTQRSNMDFPVLHHACFSTSLKRLTQLPVSHVPGSYDQLLRLFVRDSFIWDIYLYKPAGSGWSVMN